VAADSAGQRQLTLEVRLRDDATLDNYFALPPNRPPVAAIRTQLSPGGEQTLYIHGAAGCGKSHLLQSACHLAGSGSVYLPLASLGRFPPDEVLQGVEALRLVCLDDLQAVAGDGAWEYALFTLYNRARQDGCSLLVAADAAPRVLALGLPDLRSRLSWGVVYQLASADDADKAEILRFRAARRGLAMSADVAAFIVTRAPRDMDGLLALLETLDRASLAEQRALSIPFVKSALGW